MEEKKPKSGNFIFPIILMILGIVRFFMTGNFIFLLLGMGWLAVIAYESSKEK